MNTRYPLLLASLLCVTGCQVYGLLCGLDCTNVCLNGTCLKYLHECTFGCKGGNQTACALELKELKDSKTDGYSTNIIITAGATTGAIVGVAIIVAIVIVMVIRKRHQNAMKRTTSYKEQTYVNPVSDDGKGESYKMLELSHSEQVE